MRSAMHTQAPLMMAVALLMANFSTAVPLNNQVLTATMPSPVGPCVGEPARCACVVQGPTGFEFVAGKPGVFSIEWEANSMLYYERKWTSTVQPPNTVWLAEQNILDASPRKAVFTARTGTYAPRPGDRVELTFELIGGSNGPGPYSRCKFKVTMAAVAGAAGYSPPPPPPETKLVDEKVTLQPVTTCTDPWPTNGICFCPPLGQIKRYTVPLNQASAKLTVAAAGVGQTVMYFGGTGDAPYFKASGYTADAPAGMVFTFTPGASGPVVGTVHTLMIGMAPTKNWNGRYNCQAIFEIKFIAASDGGSAVPAGGQCGGIRGPTCRCSASNANYAAARVCKDDPWPWTACAPGTKCLRSSFYLWQCTSTKSPFKGNPKPKTKPPPPAKAVPNGGQCGGAFGPACANSGGQLNCVDAKWSWATCAAGVSCQRSNCAYWQCRPKAWGLVPANLGIKQLGDKAP